MAKEKTMTIKNKTFIHMCISFSLGSVLTHLYSSPPLLFPAAITSFETELANNPTVVQHAMRSRESRVVPNAVDKIDDMPSWNGVREGPFPMPIVGERFSIFQPYYDMPDAEKDPQLFGNTQQFLKAFEKRLQWVNPMINRTSLFELTQGEESQRAKFMYVEMIKSFVTATSFNAAELSVKPSRLAVPIEVKQFNKETRESAADWPYFGDTMVGWKRLDNIREILQNVIKYNIEGDYIETGVWRGGSSVFARAVIKAFKGDEIQRVSYVCDSFAGLPPGDKKLNIGDLGWDNIPYLEVSSDIVANNFVKYGLLDSNVVFVKGFFNETMPPLSKRIKKLAVMRLDGDMYESTVDVLYHLYDKLSIGGFVIMHDWTFFPSKRVCVDFFAIHGINPKIVPIDDISIYWQKTEQVNIQYWRYQQSKFKHEKILKNPKEVGTQPFS